MGQDPLERPVQPVNEVISPQPLLDQSTPTPITTPNPQQNTTNSPDSHLSTPPFEGTSQGQQNQGQNSGAQIELDGQDVTSSKGVINLPEYSVDAIMQQQNEIHAETSSKQPLIGEVEDLMNLKVEYGDDSTFLPKIAEVSEDYSRFRRMRGDGSCFYRGFLFGYLESLVTMQNLSERDRMLDSMKSLRKEMSQHCQDFIIEEFSEPFMDLLQLIGKSNWSGSAFNLQGLVSYMQEETNSNQLIFFMRMLTSHAIKMRADHFAPFILANYEDCATVEDFCQRYVEPIHEESDEYQIVALTNVLKVPVRVVYVDSRTRDLGNGKGGKSGIYTHDFVPDDCNENITQKIHLLYRPGHYDILYYG